MTREKEAVLSYLRANGITNKTVDDVNNLAIIVGVVMKILNREI